MASARKLPAPLAFPVALWVLGIVWGSGLSRHPLWLAVPAFLLCLAAWLLPRCRIYLLLALCLVAGALRLQCVPDANTGLTRILQKHPQIRQEMVFRISKVFSAQENRYEIQLYSLAGQKSRERLIYSSAAPLQPGWWYRGISDIRQSDRDPLLDLYPNRYPGKAYQLGTLTRLSRTGTRDWITILRAALMNNLTAKLGRDAIWAKGLLLSDTEAKQEHLDTLSNSGLMHLIVVSGMHVWFIYLVVVSLLRIFFSRERAELLFMPLIIFFAALNNFAPPITRSIVMIGTLVVARQIQRPLSGLQGLSLALLLITLISPRQLFNLGLQLSFVAVLVLLYGLPRFRIFSAERLLDNPGLRFWSDTIQAVMLSALVSLAIIPLTLFHFGRASLNGIIGNVLGIPLVGILLPLSLLVLLIPQSWFIAPGLKLAFSFLVHLWSLWIDFSASLPFSISGLYTGQNFTWALALGILWLFLVIRGRFRVAAYSLVPLIAVSGGLLLLPEKGIRADQNSSRAVVYMFNAGVADCVLVKLPGGQTLMVDTGGLFSASYAESTPQASEMQNNSWLQKKLLPWLSRQGIRQIDALVLSHLHADHCGGFPALAKALKVKNVFIGKQTLNQPLWQDFVKAAYLKRSRVFVLTDTLSYRIGKSYLKFLPAPKGYFDPNENNLSLVCRLDTSGKRILFSGDIESAAEQILVQKYPAELKSDYLKVPHHGSHSSSSELFLASVQPREAWLSVSRRNRFRFPHPEIVRRYQRHHILLQSTADGSFRKVIDISPK